jgi:hypothetical protein
MPLTLSRVTFETLKQKAKQVNDERVGATNDIERRKGEYERDRYYNSGTMYYCKTANMKHDENILLNECKSTGVCPKNVQEKSNAKASEGYVYVITS